MASTNENDNIELGQATRQQEGSQRGDIIDTATEQQDAGEATGQSLLPADRGMAAWRMLISAFVFEALLWGVYAQNFTHIEHAAYKNDKDFHCPLESSKSIILDFHNLLTILTSLLLVQWPQAYRTWVLLSSYLLSSDLRSIADE